MQDLSSAAVVALAMLEGDLDELCDARIARVEANRENGRGNTQPTPTDPNGGEPTPTIQSNTIQDNNNTSQINAKQALESLADGLKGQIKEFDLGLALLRRGYLVKAGELHSIYDRAAQKEHPLAYAAKAMVEADSSVRAGLAIAANFVEATGCTDTRALEVYGANIEREDGEAVLGIRCTAAARDAIGRAGQEKARGYLLKIGVTDVTFMCNGR